MTAHNAMQPTYCLTNSGHMRHLQRDNQRTWCGFPIGHEVRPEDPDFAELPVCGNCLRAAS